MTSLCIKLNVGCQLNTFIYFTEVLDKAKKRYQTGVTLTISSDKSPDSKEV